MGLVSYKGDKLSDVTQHTLREQVSFVETSAYPAEGGCYLLCLSTRQVHTIRRMCFPFVRWSTRFVRFVRPGTYDTETDAELVSQHTDEMDDLEDQLGGNDLMACTELATALAALAEALAVQPAAPNVTVSCGGGGTGGTTTQQFANCLDVPIESLVPPADIEQNPPEGDPPEGFDTWEEYNVYKCQAAHWIIDTIINSLRNIGSANLAVATGQLLAGTVLGAIAAFSAVIAPPAFLALVGVLAQLEILASTANTLLSQVADYIAARKAEIVCSMYNSGSAAEATALLNSIIEDAVEGIVFGSIFQGAAGAITPLIASVAGTLVDLGITRTLWQVTADVIYPYADCDPCDPWYGYMLATSPDSPYNVLEKGDSVSGDGGNTANGWQVQNPTTRRWYFTTEGVVTSVNLTMQYYDIHSNWTVVSARIYRTSDDQQMCAFSVPNSNEGWRDVDSTTACSLAADTGYYLGLIPEGGNSPWARAIALVALA